MAHKVVTPLYNAQGHHVVDQTDDFTVVDLRDNQAHPLVQAIAPPQSRSQSMPQPLSLVVQQCKRCGHVAHCTCKTPAPPTMDAIVEERRRQGLMA